MTASPSPASPVRMELPEEIERAIGDNRIPRVCACGDHAFRVVSKVYVCLVSPEDASIINTLGWSATSRRSCRYVAWSIRGSVRRKGELLHNTIMQPEYGFLIDHINHNGLDNRRQNLRPATPGQNTTNRRRALPNPTGFVGVFICQKNRNRPFKAMACFDNKRIYAGHFATAEEAAIARDAVSFQNLGEFAYLNFPDRRGKYEDLAPYSPAPAGFNKSKQFCIRGHEFSGRNLIVKPDGKRRCRLCDKAWLRDYRARKRAETNDKI